MIFVLVTPVRKVFLISLVLSPIVTEAQNIIDFTFVGIIAQREALTYTRSYTSLVAKSSSLVPNSYFFCYTIPCFLNLVYNLLTYQDEMIKY